MASFDKHLDSAVGMAEKARTVVTKWASKYPKWADKMAHELDDAVAAATIEIEYLEEAEIAEDDSLLRWQNERAV